jgi:hypothetical protein
MSQPANPVHAQDQHHPNISQPANPVHAQDQRHPLGLSPASSGATFRQPSFRHRATEDFCCSAVKAGVYLDFLHCNMQNCSAEPLVLQVAVKSYKD